MPRLIIKRAAIADLKAIAERINTDNPGRGFSYIEEIKAACWLWCENPLAGRDRSDLVEGLRSFPHGSYVVFYRLRPDGMAVVRVIHGKRDIPRLF